MHGARWRSEARTPLEQGGGTSRPAMRTGCDVPAPYFFNRERREGRRNLGGRGERILGLASEAVGTREKLLWLLDGNALQTINYHP
jgi:hypothetical protein